MSWAVLERGIFWNGIFLTGIFSLGILRQAIFFHVTRFLADLQYFLSNLQICFILSSNKSLKSVNSKKKQ